MYQVRISYDRVFFVVQNYPDFEKVQASLPDHNGIIKIKRWFKLNDRFTIQSPYYSTDLKGYMRDYQRQWVPLAKNILRLIDIVALCHSKSIAHGNINDKSIVFIDNEIALDGWGTPNKVD